MTERRKRFHLGIGADEIFPFRLRVPLPGRVLSLSICAHGTILVYYEDPYYARTYSSADGYRRYRRSARPW